MIAGGALLGLLVGLPSRRLVGDYLAIVTLFFGQAFVVFVNNANRINFPFIGHTDLTGGANGLDNIDPLNLFGWTVTTTKEYYYFTLGAFVLVMTLLYFVNQSRTGRAWRALREDPLAAEVMSMPINRLKLMAFVFGAATAAFAGSIYGSVQTGAFPGDFDIGLLITIYAIVILGGAGSLAGVIVAAIIVNAVPELLRDPNQAEWVFYVGLTVVVFARRAAVAATRRRRGGDDRTRFRRPRDRRRGMASADGGVLRWRRRARARGRILGPVTQRSETDRELRLRHPHRRGARIDPDPRCLAHGRARADDLPRLLRVGEPPHPADGRCDSFPPAGSVAGRPDECSATRAVRNRAGGDRLMAQKLLELRNLNKSFGGLTVISDLDLHVNEDEIVSVIGPNGAGKTTLFNLITGVYGPDDGEILLDGKSIVGLEPHQVTNRGVARTFQTLRLFLNMTRAGERHGGAVRTDKGDGARVDVPAAARAPRGEGDPRPRGREAGLLRPASRRLPLGSARVQPLVRESAAPGDRPGDGDRAAHPAPRRACGWE